MRALLVLCATWLLAGAPGAAGQPAPARELTAQPLGKALTEFAARTGLQVVYLSEIVAPLTANAVPPGLPPADALAHMLAGTGLKFEYLNARTVRIFAAGKSGSGRTGDEASGDAAHSYRRGTGESTRLDEVLVTAMHQSEWASQVPMSLSVWSQEEMRISGVKGIEELAALTPGLSFDWRSNIGAGVYTNLVTRGITGTHGVSTGIFVDDATIPVAWHDSYSRAFPSTFDIERVEILRGAQGMLLGQGTLGGAIRFITAEPSLTNLSGHASAELATTEGGEISYEAGIAAGGPIVDEVLGIRASGWIRSDGGFIDHVNPFDPQNIEPDTNEATSMSGRIGLAWRLSEATRVTSKLSYDSNRIDDPSSYFVHQSDPAHGVFRNSYLIRQPREDRFYLASIKLEHESDVGDFLAASTYIDRSSHSIHDLNCSDDCGIPLFAFVADAGQRAIQQELRWASPDPAARLTWLAGAHFSRTESVGRAGDAAVATDELTGVRLDQTRSEGYLELSRKLGPHVTASAGARIAFSSYDYSSLLAPRSAGGDDESRIVPRFNLSYYGKAGNLFYLTAAMGYGVGSVTPMLPGCESVELLADTVWNYEVGAKTSLLGGRAQVEFSVFESRWGNRQQEAVIFSCLAGFQKGEAESHGFELVARSLVGERATAGVELSYIDSRYTHSVVADGIQIVHAGDAVLGARLPVNLAAYVDYELPPMAGIHATLHAEYHFYGGDPRRRLESRRGSPFYQAFATSDVSTGILNLRADAQAGRTDIAFFVNNALDSHPIVNRANYFGGCCIDGGVHTAYTLRPRTVGVSASWRF